MTSMKVPPNFVPALQLATSVMRRRDKLRTGSSQVDIIPNTSSNLGAPGHAVPGRRARALGQLESRLAWLSEMGMAQPTRQAEWEAQAARSFLLAVLHAEWGEESLSTQEWETLLAEVWASLNSDPAQASDWRQAGAELLSVIKPQSAAV